MKIENCGNWKFWKLWKSEIVELGNYGNWEIVNCENGVRQKNSKYGIQNFGNRELWKWKTVEMENWEIENCGNWDLWK